LYDTFCAVLYVLRTGCQWRALPSDFPKWSTVYSYFRKWSQANDEGISVLELALKKSAWRGPSQAGAQRTHQLLDRGRAEREEH
jgi:transposase